MTSEGSYTSKKSEVKPDFRQRSQKSELKSLVYKKKGKVVPVLN
jgi:hypothetical protein